MPDTTPWYKSGSGILFLCIIGVIGIVVVLFLGHVGYYAWQLKFGDAKRLTEQFAGGFTKTPGLENQAAPEVIAVDQYIHADNPLLGNAAAPVTIVMFMDFGCPFCREAEPIISRVAEQFGSAIRIVFKHFPIEPIHAGSTHAALASMCAGEQGAFWQLQSRLLNEPTFDDGSLETARVTTMVQALGINMMQFDGCMTSQKYAAIIDRDIQDGLDLKIRGTPTYFLNGKRIEGVQSEAIWKTLVIEAIQQSAP